MAFIVVPVGLGLVAIYLLLPRPRAYSWLWGSALAAGALLSAAWLLLRHGFFSAETLLFYAFSGIAVVSAGLLVTQRNPVRAALAFALVVLSTCGLFLLQAAPFLMAATTIIYAGAIIVTFLFVIMLAQQSGFSDADLRSREPLFSCVAGFVLLGALLYAIFLSSGPEASPLLLDETPAAHVRAIRHSRGHPVLPAHNVEALGKSLFSYYLLPVELGGTLLLVATIGAIAITGRGHGVRR
jgi:NADH-quinone oxidoreductase subunit J